MKINRKTAFVRAMAMLLSVLMIASALVMIVPYVVSAADESEDYLEMVTKYPNLQFGLCGHIHTTAIHHPFKNHVPYYQTACAEKLSYLLFHLKADGTYTYEEIFV